MCVFPADFGRLVGSHLDFYSNDDLIFCSTELFQIVGAILIFETSFTIEEPSFPIEAPSFPIEESAYVDLKLAIYIYQIDRAVDGPGSLTGRRRRWCEHIDF